MSQLVTEMDLPLLPAEQPDFSVNPMPAVEEARRKHPWLAKSNVGGYIIHGYQATKDIVGMDTKLRPFFDGVVDFYGAANTEWGDFMSEMMIARHGPEHTRMRSSFQVAFTPKNINRYRDLMREVISELLDKWAPKGQFDFSDFASYFPISVFCGVLGVPRQIVPKIRDALENQAASTQMNKDLLPIMLDGFKVLWDFADTAVTDREKQGPGNGDLLDVMIAAKKAGKINHKEVCQNLIMLAAGGYDTSKNILGLIMLLMMQHPDQWKRCAEDVDYCRKVVEETLRHSSIASVYRGVSEEFEYDGVTFPKGTVLFFLMGLAGRDPAVFANPMDFQPERANVDQHVAFGRGKHFCIGLHLARAQLTEGVHLIAQRIRNPRLVGEVTWRPYLGIWGARSIPIKYDPAPAPAPRQAAE
jgi:cytochrome P450